MATILPGQYQQQQQQPLQNSFQPQASVTSTQDPLFEALVKYTKSSDGPDLSENDIQKYYQQTIGVEGGSAYLTSLITGSVNDSLGRQWDTQGIVSAGELNVTTSTFAFNFTIGSKSLKCTGSTNNLFQPGKILLGGATLYFNDLAQISTAACDFQAFIYHPHNRESVLVIDFYDNTRRLIATLQKRNVYLTLPPALAGAAQFSLT